MQRARSNSNLSKGKDLSRTNQQMMLSRPSNQPLRFLAATCNLNSLISYVNFFHSDGQGKNLLGNNATFDFIIANVGFYFFNWTVFGWCLHYTRFIEDDSHDAHSCSLKCAPDFFLRVNKENDCCIVRPAFAQGLV